MHLATVQEPVVLMKKYILPRVAIKSPVKGLKALGTSCSGLFDYLQISSIFVVRPNVIWCLWW